MNENIDLTKILKDCPMGWKFYSSVYGEVEFVEILPNVSLCPVIFEEHGSIHGVSISGEHFKGKGECTLFPSRDQRDWSKFTAPWLKKESDTIDCLEKQGEQEEPQVYETEDGEIITYSETDGYKFDKPKFHKWQWIACKGLNTALIINIVDNNYEVEFLDGNKVFSTIDYVDRRFHLWTIQDAKNGDILAACDCYVIFKEIAGLNIKCYCTYHYLGFNPGLYRDTVQNKSAFLPATKEQHDAMMKAMNDAGYKWNAKTKTLEELIKPKFDPKTLKPFDRVLARKFKKTKWHCEHFSHFDGDNYNPCIASYCSYTFCIPYNEETKHLVGTKEEAPDFYRYWED